MHMVVAMHCSAGIICLLYKLASCHCEFHVVQDLGLLALEFSDSDADTPMNYLAYQSVTKRQSTLGNSTQEALYSSFTLLSFGQAGVSILTNVSNNDVPNRLNLCNRVVRKICAC